MRKNILLSAIVLIAAFAAEQSNATVWRINNNGIQADFTTVQAAHDAAAVQPGDTLHLEPSPTNYGNLLLMTKRLTIISIGHFLSDNPGSQFATVSGVINSLSFSNTATASNSVFHCTINDVTLNYADSVRFERCKIGIGTNTGLSISFNSDNNVIINSYIYDINAGQTKNTLIANNIIMASVRTADETSATIVNNVIQATQSAITGVAINNAIFRNNIINKSRPYNFVNCTVENNITSNTTLPAGNGNQNSVIMTNVFKDPNGMVDNAFVLQTASANPAKAAGVAGVDCGAFGSSSPFKLALQPAIPAIYKLIVPPSASGNTMNITFSTRSNN
jgi:hypothetical protein